MKVEMESLYSNHVWELVELLVKLNPLAVSRSIREKENSMVRLILLMLDWWPKDLLKKNELIIRKHFHQLLCLSLFEFSLSIATHFDNKIWQMDVKISILNGNLDEDIYMIYLDGFIAKGRKHMVCNLHRFIYGLKQASRS